jgi:hypothetical protein
MRVALVTACYGAYDPVRSLPEGHGFDDAVLVTDDRDIQVEGWRVHYEPRPEAPRLAAKRPKMMPWLYTDCDAAVWLDASFEVLTPALRGWVVKHLDVNDFVVWTHPEGRVDFADEAAVCLDWPKYRDFDIRGQVGAYLRDGMPRGWGLFACGMIGYRFTSEVKALGVAWLAEQERWSVQDQVSLPYLLWRSGMPFGVWQANEYENPYVRIRWDERPRPQD